MLENYMVTVDAYGSEWEEAEEFCCPHCKARWIRYADEDVWSNDRLDEVEDPDMNGHCPECAMYSAEVEDLERFVESEDAQRKAIEWFLLTRGNAELIWNAIKEKCHDIVEDELAGFIKSRKMKEYAEWH